MQNREVKKIKDAIEFTRIYNEHSDDKYIREARCVDFQCKHILQPLDENDWIAGKIEHGYVGFSSQYGGIYTYFFNEFSYRTALQKTSEVLDEETLTKAGSILDYWTYENTQRKHNNAFVKIYGFEPGHTYKCPGFGNCDSRVAGTTLEFRRLLTLGLDGLDQLVDAYMVKNNNQSFYQALHMWIQTLRDLCEIYRLQALDFAKKFPKRVKHFEQLSVALKNIQHQAPDTFLEGVQLIWIYSIFSDTMNYGRMDDDLAELYQKDLYRKTMDEEEAIQIVLGLYKHLKEVNKVHDCRIIIGGKGRKSEKAADQVAMIFMEATKRFAETVPQLTLRYYHGMDPKVFHKAMEVNAQGCTFPIIYSDETNIPAIQKVYGVNEKEAEQWVPFGCGEYVLCGLSTGTPNTTVNLLKALEITLHNGYDPYHHLMVGAKTGKLEKLATFDQLFQAWKEQLIPVVDYLAVHQKLNYDVAGQEAAYLNMSLLMQDCLEKGKGLLEGGVRYLNAASEIYGIISCADSFYAINEVVYKNHEVSLSELVTALDADFIGYEKLRKRLLSVEKYGNDLNGPDMMAVKVFDTIAELTREVGKKTGLHRYEIVSVNNSMSADWGRFVLASADGRKAGHAMSNGNGPSNGSDQNGVTALLNSMRKINPTMHVGVIHNIRFTKQMFQTQMSKIEMLLKIFYENGGVQTNLCVIGKDDLENAMKEPENYKNLIVRIGGFSARFVTLDPAVQRELIDRTTYEA